MVMDFGGKAMAEAGGQQQARRRVQDDKKGCSYAVSAEFFESILNKIKYFYVRMKCTY